MAKLLQLHIYKASDSIFHPFYVSVIRAIKLQTFSICELSRKQLLRGYSSKWLSHQVLSSSFRWGL